jgi:hypothetical protein
MGNTKRKKPKRFNSQDTAHHKNLFFQKLLTIADAVSSENPSGLFSKNILEQVYDHRCRLIKVIADEKLNFSASDLQEVKNAVVFKLKSNCWKFKNTGKDIVLYDFAGPGISLYLFLSIVQERNPERYARLILAHKDFLDTPELFIDLQKIIYNATNYIGWELTELDKRIVSPLVSYKVAESDKPYLYIEVALKIYPIETVSVNFDGNVRQAFRVGIASNGSEPFWLKLKAGKLGLDRLAPDTKLPVYIQKHALNRLKERIDCAEPSMALLNLALSLEKGQCRCYRGKRLIEFEFFRNKIGYLLFDIINDIVVVRTFLLLTHFDTPEGDNLHRIIGLEKPDITYLNLDKLSTFVFSEIRDKAIVRDLFTRAGCEKLLDVPKKDFDKESSIDRAEIIESYLLKYQEHKEQLNIDSLINLHI